MSSGQGEDQNSSNKATGQFHSAKGTLVEGIGNVTGAKTWIDSGKREHKEGENEYKAAQASDFVEGIKDDVVGRKDNILGAVKDDPEQQMKGEVRSKKGKAQKEANRPE